MSPRHNREGAEDTLGKGEEFLTSLVQHVLDVVAILDADGAMRYVSPAVKAMLGYAPEEVGGTAVLGYVHPDELERAFGALAETLSTPGVLPPMVAHRLRRSVPRWVCS